MQIDHEKLIPRISGTGDFIGVDTGKCTLCGRCLVICVMSLWKRRGDTVYLADDYASKCVECAACYQVCEAGAIKFHYPAGGTGIVCKKG
jgi:NAD-dependent dihydropyrimidine dehydrogenase PreA subunit